MNGVVAARALLKLAASRNLAKPLLSALHTSGKLVGKVVHGGVAGAANVGEGIAEGLGAGEGGQLAGKLLGGTAAVGAGYEGYNRTKQRVNEWRYRHGLY